MITCINEAEVKRIKSKFNTFYIELENSGSKNKLNTAYTALLSALKNSYQHALLHTQTAICALDTVNKNIKEIHTTTSIPLTDFTINHEDTFRYMKLRTPQVNTENTALIAFQNKKGNIATVKIGRIFSALYQDLINIMPELKILVDFVAENVTQDYVKARELTCSDWELFVSSDPKAFQYAYLKWDWNTSTSCMAQDEWEINDAKKLRSEENVCISDNPHCQFYTDLINENGDKIQVNIAMLLDKSSCVAARCLLWWVGEQEWYADRVYYNERVHADILIQKLYNENLIKYNKIIGCGCRDTLAIVDKNNDPVSKNIIRRWRILVKLDYNDPIAYMDTFKYYHHNEGYITPYGYDLWSYPAHTSKHDGILDGCKKHLRMDDCDHCGTPIFHTGGDSNHYEFIDDVYLCPACAAKYVFTCDECGERRYGTQRTLDGNTYCESCYDDLVTVCDGCHNRVLKDSIRIIGAEGYCDRCYASLFIRCDECDDIIRKSDAVKHENHAYCETCYNDLFAVCSNCGSIISRGEDPLDRKYDSCPNCYNTLTEDEQDTPPMTVKPYPIFVPAANAVSVNP
jgi:hypothetical protein